MNKRFQEIMSLAQSGQQADALKKCERALKKKPREVNFLLLAASLYAQNNQFNQVRDYCVRAVKVEPKNISALYNLGIACLFLKDYESTIRYSLDLVNVDSKHARAYANLGLAYWNIGELDKAKESALSANKFDPEIATNHNNLGLIYKGLNQVDKAIEHFKQAMKLDVQLAEAYYNCGICMIDAGDESGNSLLEKALLIKPDYAEVYNYQGLKLLENDQTAQSIENFKKAITIKPDYVEAYNNLGNVFITERNFYYAEAMFRKAIEHAPDSAAGYNNLANALLDQDEYRQNFSEAVQSYLKAIELAPQLNDTYKNLAVCYQGEGRLDEAMEYFNLYNEREPNDEVVIASMASVHERRAEYDEGISLITPFLDKSDVNVEIILAYAKLAKYLKQENDAIEALVNIDDDQTPNKFRIEKYFSLGKLSEPKGDADETFAYYKKANDLDEEEYDISKEKNTFNKLKSFYTKEKIQTLARSENTSSLPIFIVGMPRSGTSLAEQILSSHPDVYGAGELDNMNTIVQKMTAELKPANSYPTSMDSMTEEYATKIANQHLETLQQMSSESKYIVDKMPHNFQGLGVINLLFPGATVIQCKRSSVDTCLSIYFQHFNKHHSYSNSLKMLGQYYNLYADLMEHWKKTLDINIIELEYEKVIANPEEQMRWLLDQCNIEWDPACLKFYENKRTVMTPSYDQVRRPIYSSSVAKWKKHEHNLTDLIEHLGNRAY